MSLRVHVGLKSREYFAVTVICIYGSGLSTSGSSRGSYPLRFSFSSGGILFLCHILSTQRIASLRIYLGWRFSSCTFHQIRFRPLDDKLQLLRLYFDCHSSSYHIWTSGTEDTSYCENRNICQQLCPESEGRTKLLISVDTYSIPLFYQSLCPFVNKAKSCSDELQG